MAAIRAAQLGMDVTVVEEDRLGGECTNYACIPSKALLHIAELYHSVKGAGVLGLKGDVEVDWRAAQTWKEGVVDRLRRGIKLLLESNGVRIVSGRGLLVDPRTVKVNGNRIEADRVIVATGSRPTRLPTAPFGERIIDTRRALSLGEVPSDMLVVGGGAAGVEIASIYSRLGSSVTLVELMDQLLPGMDHDIAAQVKRRLEELGVKVLTSSQVAKAMETGSRVEVTVSTPGGQLNGTYSHVVVSVGRVPNTEAIGVELERDSKGHILTGSDMRTSVPTVFAVGDVTGPPYLAHKASAQGRVAAEAVAGKDTRFEPRAIPLVVFSDPEVVSVGMTEREARERGIAVSTARFPFSALGRAVAVGRTDGFVKVVVDGDGVVLGVHAVGHNVSELAAAFVELVEFGATVHDVDLLVYPHPTLGEAILEAAEMALGKPIHLVRR